MRHRASPRFWACYRRLPEDVQGVADRGYQLLCNNPRHPSLHFKKVQDRWSVRVGLRYRALAIEEGEDLLWVWIGTHEEYNQLIRH
jgi:hypothetical protein